MNEWVRQWHTLRDSAMAWKSALYKIPSFAENRLAQLHIPTSDVMADKRKYICKIGKNGPNVL